MPQDLETWQDPADGRRTERFWRLYERLFNTSRPPGWKVFWHIEAITLPKNKSVIFTCNSMRPGEDLDTVVHEMLHIKDPRLEHGKEFERECRRLLRVAISPRRPKPSRRPNRQSPLPRPGANRAGKEAAK